MPGLEACVSHDSKSEKDSCFLFWSGISCHTHNLIPIREVKWPLSPSPYYLNNWCDAVLKVVFLIRRLFLATHESQAFCTGSKKMPKIPSCLWKSLVFQANFMIIERCCVFTEYSRSFCKHLFLKNNYQLEGNSS